MYKIITASKEHLPGINKLYENNFGHGLKELQAGKNHLQLAIEDKERVVAYSAAWLAENMIGAFPVGQEKLAAQLKERLDVKEPIGVLKTSIVDKKYRRQGTGNKLIKHRLQWLKSQGAEDIFCFAWMSEEGTMASSPLKENGLEVVSAVPKFWQRESIIEDYQCADCGQPCSCSVSIFYCKLS